MKPLRLPNMAPGCWAAAVFVLGAGAVAEGLARSSSTVLAAMDFTVGAGFTAFAAWLATRAQRQAWIALAVAGTWFLGTVAGASSTAVSSVGSLFLLGYRGPLVQLLIGGHTGGGRRWRHRSLVATCWVAGFLPPTTARWATAAVAAVVAVTTATRWRSSPADQRLSLVARSAAALVLASVWAFAIVDGGQATALLVVDDLAVFGAGGLVVVETRSTWARSAATALVVELGPGGHRGQPVEERLARFLADPALQLRYRSPGRPWFDEQGRSVADPDAEDLEVTRASAPAGGQVALVHSRGSSRDPLLAEAAASAAALVMDSARLQAELYARSAELRASRRRLLTAGDAERRALEERLASEVLGRLRRVEELLTDRPELSGAVAELRDAIAEVSDLGLGLYPPALARRDLGGALEDLARLCSVPVRIELVGDLGSMPASTREALWFTCSEALTNVTRHSGASEAVLRAVADDGAITVEICDNGCGGATLTRGLRDLADRVDALGGTFVVDSPAGGPTAIKAALPST